MRAGEARRWGPGLLGGNKMNFRDILRRWWKKLVAEEAALVVSWFDIIVLLCFTMFIFMLLGPLMDQLYIYMHYAPMNITMGDQTMSFYTASDLQTSDDLYELYKWLPYLALGVVIYYAINYSNFKRGSE